MKLLNNIMTLDNGTWDTNGQNLICQLKPIKNIVVNDTHAYHHQLLLLPRVFPFGEFFYFPITIFQREILHFNSFMYSSHILAGTIPHYSL